jgi:pimeloyl-ACP methyl ester carboxylesterase
MKKQALSGIFFIAALSLFLLCTNHQSEAPTGVKEEITFESGDFKIVGELRLPVGEGPHPVVVFVHGDGPNDRISGGTYPPIMERMLRAGYATFAWDKPGSGESTGELASGRVFEQRTAIVLDAIEVLKRHKAIDARRIGLWGISQGGYIMPLVLGKSEDVAFMIAVSCPGEAGYMQGAYLVAEQTRCEGLSPEEARELEYHLEYAEIAQTYEDYYKHKSQAFRHKDLVESMGMRMSLVSEKEWEPPNLESDYYFDPISIIEKTAVPVLAFYGERDTQVDPIQGMQAYKAALERAGNENYRIELIPGVDHCMIVTETGCLKEIFNRSREERLAHGKLYLDIIEKWLGELSLQIQ